jgi:NOL1/NOP2/fmu family ribosome biogenesis protein
MFRTEIAVSEWSPGNTAHCAERQKRILMDTWPALKENGILIYSTCTFNPGENEENVKWLIDRNEAEAIKMDLKTFMGITEINFQGIYGYGFYPGKVRGEGFFISAIRKKSKQDQIHPKSHRLSENKPGKSDLNIAAGWIDFQSDRIVRWGDEIIAVPCDLDIFNFIFRNLKVVKAGTKISVIKKNDTIPSHELAFSTRLKRQAFPGKEISLEEAISYLRRDNFNVRNIPKGWNIVTYKGINLGFIKNLGDRVNNYFPVEWRIRLDASAIRQANPISWQE